MWRRKSTLHESFRDQVRNGHVRQPTQRGFSPEAWLKDFEQSGDTSDSAESLYASGLIVFAHLETFRRHLEDLRPLGPPGPSGARLLVGLCNWVLSRARGTLFERVTAEADVVGGFVASTAGADLGRSAERMIEGLRFPIAELARASDGRDLKWVELRSRLSGAVDVGVQYHNFESMWLDCLWGDHEVLPANGLSVFRPSDPRFQACRVIGRTRREALAVEVTAHSLKLWMDGPPVEMLKLAQRPRVTGVRRRGKRAELVVRSETPDFPPQGMILRAIATQFYDEPLLREPLPEYSDLSAYDLLDAWEVLQPLSEVLRERLPDSPTLGSANQLRQCAPTLSKRELAKGVKKALGLDAHKARAAVEALTFPNDARSDLWLFPFVEAGNEKLAVLYDVLGSPNLMRSVEHWLKTGGLDLEARGPLFEDWVRTSLRDVCVLATTEVLPRNLEFTDGKQTEEIDLLIRVGETVLVGEVKCTVSPATPITEYRYWTVLEEAAQQARRKADFIKRDLGAFSDAVGWQPTQGVWDRIRPLVVTNLPLGLGWAFQGVPIVDLMALSFFFGKGEVRREVVMDARGGLQGQSIPLQRDGEDPEDALDRFLRSPAQLDAYYDHLSVRVTRPVQFSDDLDPVCRVIAKVDFPQIIAPGFPSG
jgi:hypothetical protein